jgi:hypothetical protein
VTQGPGTVPPPVGADPWARRRRALIPILIALTSVLGSVAAWRASAASGAAGGAEGRAFADTLAAEQQTARIETELASTEFTYARRRSLEAAASALRIQADAADAAGAAQLDTLAGAYEAAAATLLGFISTDAIDTDGDLDLEAMEQAEWSLVEDLQDLDPAEESAEGESLRTKSQRLVGLTALLIAAALFLTLAEVSRRPRVAILYWRGGLLVLATSVVLLIVVAVR